MTALFGPSFTSKDRELMDFLATPEHKFFLEDLWQKFRPYLKPAQEAEFLDLEAQSVREDGRRDYQRVSNANALR